MSNKLSHGPKQPFYMKQSDIYLLYLKKKFSISLLILNNLLTLQYFHDDVPGYHWLVANIESAVDRLGTVLIF